MQFPICLHTLSKYEYEHIDGSKSSLQICS